MLVASGILAELWLSWRKLSGMGNPMHSLPCIAGWSHIGLIMNRNVMMSASSQTNHQVVFFFPS